MKMTIERIETLKKTMAGMLIPAIDLDDMEAVADGTMSKEDAQRNVAEREEEEGEEGEG